MAKTKIADVITPAVFAPYVINATTEKSALWQSGIISTMEESAQLAQRGGTAVNMPYWNDLDGEAEVLSDSTALSVGKITAGSDVAVLHARGKAWSANDLATSLSGDDPSKAIADLAAAYWDRQMQKMLLSTLGGVFAATSMADNVLDISTKTGAAANFSGEAMIDAAYKLGDEVGRLTAVAMHSATAAVLAKQGLIETIRDSEGNVLYQTYQEKRVIVDDGLPVEAGKYTTYLFGEGAIGYGEVAPEHAVEIAREALASDDVLINRRHFVLHPRGVKWAGTTGLAPNNAGLATGTNWERVYDPKKIRVVAFKHKLG